MNNPTLRRFFFGGALGAVAALPGVACDGHVPSRPANCSNYIVCYEATGGTKGALEGKYGPMGSCWMTTTAAATACNDECIANLAALSQAFPDAGC